MTREAQQTISAAIEQIRGRIEAACRQYRHRPDCASLLAVSKTFPAETLRLAHTAGLRRFGESYLDEAEKKLAALADLDAEWHFIGPLQSNKTRRIAALFDWVQSVDRLKTARRLADQRPAGREPLNICLQVNISGETSKAGVVPEELNRLAAAVSELPALRLRGLMAIPARTTDFTAQRAAFATLRRLYDELIRQGHTLDTLSMGMTGDLEAAIAEGSTLVRVGRGIFGERI